MSELGTSTRRPFDAGSARRTVFEALTIARREHGAHSVALVDGDDRSFTYDEIVLASFALGSALKRGTRSGECVGVMLPTGAAAALTFFALSAYGRIPTMLNFTSGLASLRSALATAKVKRVVTARRLVEVAGLQALVDNLGAEIVYLEDVRKSLSLANKLTGAAGKIAPDWLAAKPDPSQPAVILFTSGTEGEPKGVVLSHANILANVEQVRAHVPIFPTDVLFNPMPTFHSFASVSRIAYQRVRHSTDVVACHLFAGSPRSGCSWCETCASRRLHSIEQRPVERSFGRRD